MEMPDVIYAAIYTDQDPPNEWRVIKITGSEQYHHSRIVEALRRENEELKAKMDKANKEIGYLHTEIDDCHKRLNNWADAHSEMIGEVELRELIAKLEEFIKTTHPYPEQR